MIKFDWVSKYFESADWRIDILTDASFEIPKNKFVSLMAPSWSGKTTILNIISWLDDYQSGNIYINQKLIKHNWSDELTTRRGQNISFIFQQFYLIPQLTVTENIDLVIDINNLKRQFETSELISMLWLTNRANAYPFQLSGGEQQRVAIARAFVWDTAMILADEPTGNLDATNAAKIMEIIHDLHQKTNKTILMITHDKNIADQADYTITLSNHKII